MHKWWPWSGCGPACHWPQFWPISQGALIVYQNCMECLPGRQEPPLVGSRISLPSLSPAGYSWKLCSPLGSITTVVCWVKGITQASLRSQHLPDSPLKSLWPGMKVSKWPGLISASFEVHKTYLFEARDREQAANRKIRSSKKLGPQPTL